MCTSISNSRTSLSQFSPAPPAVEGAADIVVFRLLSKRVRRSDLLEFPRHQQVQRALFDGEERPPRVLRTASLETGAIFYGEVSKKRHASTV